MLAAKVPSFRRAWGGRGTKHSSDVHVHTLKDGAARFEESASHVAGGGGGELDGNIRRSANPVFFSDLISKGNASERLVCFFFVFSKR